MTARPASPPPDGLDASRDPGPGPGRNGRVGWLMAGSPVAGFLAAVLLAVAPFIP
ncbi:hypothetical protein [Arthrobacter sp. B0490]|uniref:hypothetical protein n=1 Tax=Arthrobacter sp. B0490 TaxID=2058891 RepID=UPI001CA54830|nr:hypothetical protein [Arthrobacter sp. B0490]